MTPAAKGAKISLRLGTPTVTCRRSANRARAERIVNAVVDALLAAEAFDEVAVEFEGPQNELTAGDVLTRAKIPDAVLDRVAAELEAQL